jgi:hypothetical protein
MTGNDDVDFGARKRPPITAIVVALALVAGGVYYHLATRPIAFDAAIWRAGETADVDDSPRLRMADGLVENGALLGKSRLELEAMLGRPSETSKWRDYDLVYWLGPERGLIRIDSEWLVVRFGSDGSASIAKIVRD